MITLFFFQCYGDPRDLHSFPTRRSSDLSWETPRRRWRSGRRPSSRTSATIRPPSRSSRSEEHTSELQSHVNLVCRLLLEKKKQNTNTSAHSTSGLYNIYLLPLVTKLRPD